MLPGSQTESTIVQREAMDDDASGVDAAATISYVRDALLVLLPTRELADDEV
jgi:hypothetical protein